MAKTLPFFPKQRAEAPTFVRDSEVTCSLLELAAEDDLEGFRDAVQKHSPDLGAPAPWYHRHYASQSMGYFQVTPAMIASLYGSLDVLRFILSFTASIGVKISTVCDTEEGTSALHYACAGCSLHALDMVKCLLSHGAEVNAVDAHGMRPFDVMMGVGKEWHGRSEMERLLTNGAVDRRWQAVQEGRCLDEAWNLQFLDDNSFPLHTAKPFSTEGLCTPCPSLILPATGEEVLERWKESPFDPTVSDVKNTIYTSDDFRMFSFKVRPCSRAYSHDWTECPFAHSGENARRRDPRKFHYSCVPCPDFRKGACRFGDACEYAHGIFESWLHPAQYRTRLCKDGVGCVRRVCFFAHTKDELRPLYISSGSAVPSPRGPSFHDHVSSPVGMVSSPSSFSMAGSFFPPLQKSHQMSSPTPTMSPKGSWASSSVPTLHLPSGGSVHASRLRAALTASNRPFEVWGMAEGHLKADGAGFSSRMAKYDEMNLDSAYGMDDVSPPSSPFQDPMCIHPTNTQLMQPPTPPRSYSLLQSQLYPRAQLSSSAESPMHRASMASSQAQQGASQPPKPLFYSAESSRDGMRHAENEVMLPARGKRLTSCPIDAGVPNSHGFSLADWSSPTGKLEWGVQKEDLCRLRSSTGLQHAREASAVCVTNSGNLFTVEAGGCNVSNDEPDSVLGFWLEEMQLDEITV